MESASLHNHTRPQIVILKEVKVLIAASFLNSLPTEYDRWVVDRIAFTCKLYNILMVSWWLA
jgi:hypothetical protein